MMDKKIGMYVHMHWGYRHPYSARTWKSGDWAGYASGLVDLGYNQVMVWPMLETIPDDPTPSDINHLENMRSVIHTLKSRFGMQVLMTMGPNTMANQHASEYTFETRPFFKTTERLNPADKTAMDRMFSVRAMQMEYLAEADGIVVIDSDPGGYVGSTNMEFVGLLERFMDLASASNPDSVLYHWMWLGWETYNRMWEATLKGDAVPEIPTSREDFDDVLGALIKSSRSNWRLFSCFPVHQDIIDKYNLRDRAMFFPYGLIEGEPTFPFTNWNLDSIKNEFKRYNPSETPLGIMANAQTHALQLPNTFAFAREAGGDCMGCETLEDFANALIPGEGLLISRAWEALQGNDSSIMYALVPELREKSLEDMFSGSAGGLLLMTPGEFMEDLAYQLEFKADIVDLRSALATGETVKYAVGSLARSWKRWQIRTGFVDAYCDVLGIHETLKLLNDPAINSIIVDFDNWRTPEIRHGLLTRLLEALDDWSSR